MTALIGPRLKATIARLAIEVARDPAKRTRRFAFVCAHCRQANDVLVHRSLERIDCYTYACAGCQRVMGKALASAAPIVRCASGASDERRTGSYG